MTNLTIFDKHLPLRAMDGKQLEHDLNHQFKFWIANLLSLKEDKEDAYDVCKSAIKDLCIGMGFNEIKQMFEMYVDSKLELTPISNYFDRILLGKIVNSYKKIMAQKPKALPEQPKPDQQQSKKDIEAAVTCSYLEFKNTGYVNGVITHIYNYLDSQDKFQGSKTDDEWVKYKWKVFGFCKKIVKENQNFAKIGVIIEDATTMSKRKILVKYYKQLK